MLLVTIKAFKNDITIILYIIYYTTIYLNRIIPLGTGTAAAYRIALEY